VLTAAGWRPIVQTYFNSILLAPIAAVRLVSSDKPRSDYDLAPKPLNEALVLPMRGEAAFIARGGRLPVITLSVPSVLVMIPGVAAHEALVSLNRGDYASATAGILQVTLVVLSIMVGLVAAKLVTDRDWAFGRT